MTLHEVLQALKQLPTEGDVLITDSELMHRISAATSRWPSPTVTQEQIARAIDATGEIISFFTAQRLS